jgi:hypothetical protein
MKLGQSNITSACNKTAQHLIRRGHATVDEILTTSFGEWPPKGLDIVGKNDQPVEIRSMHEYWADRNKGKSVLNRVKSFGEVFFHRFRVGGHALPESRTIDFQQNKINSQVKAEYVKSSLGHEGIHVLQFDHTSSRLNGTYGPSSGGIYFATPSNIDRWLSEENSLIKGNLISEKNYSDDVHHIVEVQARLHELVTHGYQQWQKLPASKLELQSALYNIGIEAPPSVEGNILSYQQSKTGDAFSYKRNVVGGMALLKESIRPSFLSRKKAEIGIAHDIETSIIAPFKEYQSNLTPEGRKLFWEKVLPKTYVDLLELYGDREGRARFGYGENPWIEVRESRHSQPSSEIFANNSYRKAELIGATNAYIGLAMGAKGLYDKLYDGNSAYNRDIQSGGIRFFCAKVGLAADAANLLAGAVDFSHHLASALKSPAAFEAAEAAAANSKFLTPFKSVAGRVAIPLTFIAGYAEFAAGCEAHDIHRMRQAIGGTAGGLAGGTLGGMVAGALAGSVIPGPGTFVGAAIGLVCGIGGSLAGSWIGSTLVDKGMMLFERAISNLSYLRR